jgi:hypothetical protein
LLYSVHQVRSMPALIEEFLHKPSGSLPTCFISIPHLFT